MSRPRLPSMYLRDVFPFMKRTEMKKLQLVSIRVDDVIGNLPTWKLPRRRLEGLQLLVLGTENAILIREDGYANFGSTYVYRPPIPWRKLSESWGCCDELKEYSSLLAGQLLCEGAGPNSVLQLSVGCLLAGRDRPVMEMLITNRMTVTTAFAVIHLLHHLHDVAFEEVLLNAVPALSPALQILSNCYCGGHSKKGSFLRLHTRCVSLYSPMSGQNLAMMADTFHAKCASVSAEEERNLPAALELISTGGRYFRKLRLRLGPDLANGLCLRGIVNHFESGVNTLNGVIPCVMIDCHWQGNWPETFQKEDAVAILSNTFDDLHYEFAFTHAQSMEAFNLTIVWYKKWACVTSLTLRFSD